MGNVEKKLRKWIEIDKILNIETFDIEMRNSSFQIFCFFCRMGFFLNLRKIKILFWWKQFSFHWKIICQVSNRRNIRTDEIERRQGKASTRQNYVVTLFLLQEIHIWVKKIIKNGILNWKCRKKSFKMSQNLLKILQKLFTPSNRQNNVKTALEFCKNCRDYRKSYL